MSKSKILSYVVLGLVLANGCLFLYLEYFAK